MGSESTFGADRGLASTIALLEAQQPVVEERLRRAEAEVAAATAERDAMAKALEGLRLLSWGKPVDDGIAERAAELPRSSAAEVVQEAGAVSETEAAAAPAEQEAAPAQDGPAVATAGAGRRSVAKKATAKKVAAKKATAKKTASVPEQEAPAPVAKRTARKAVAKGSEGRAATKRTSTVRKAARAETEPVAGGSPVEAPAPRTGARRKVADAESVLEVLSQAAAPLRAREVADLLGLDILEGNINAIRTRLERLARDGRAQRSGRGLYTAADGGPQAAD
ncbi:hypothetical protein GCM10009665_61600 [Kitasatospora nipponensis]|uniref:Uncharacterized protein n=1 Tax=Kitasatospora nipponensis TaxID=258049 RepID=A0ABN1WSW2_9ACTN